ncbi:TRAP transporter small permease [Chelativorans sp. AA-79]|uniref:TRAP transporter small permease n=1 Tax=Chelativorans sp. AA-79 TaxID=3028735 RepID=UPI0023F6C80C|nr:TRAP transporter small permease [Chelativorans sp. AA-79]WEX09684.1 TRAP transporter small permease [Chelativorans sp. AA-79]
MSTEGYGARSPEEQAGATSGFALGLLAVSRFFAGCGGLILLGVVVVTTASVAGRYLFSLPVPGDYEITEFGCGIAILLFFPFCEMTRANIKAEFFTMSLPERWRHFLDLVSEVAFVGVAALIGWRLVIGGLKRLADGQSYMHLGIPLWWGYVPGAFAMALLVVVCLWRGYDSFRRMQGAHAS